tara:strand:- start:523 stop:708 length:186 start_codon:yes stop_codon:yes gene_type:complete
MSKETVEALKDRLAVFDDSDEVVELLLPIDSYAAREAAAHIKGLWILAVEMMKYIEEKTNG